MTFPHSTAFRSSPAFAGAANSTVAQSLRLGLFLLMLVVAGCSTESESESTTVSDDQVSLADGDASNSSGPVAGEPDPPPSGGGGGSSSVGEVRFAAMPSPLSIMLPNLTVTDFVVISSRRITRSKMEYVLKLKLANASSEVYEDVQATLLGAPNHIEIIDPIVTVGDVPANATILSSDTFTVVIDLAVATAFDDFIWQFQGDIKPPPPPPPPGTGPSEAGIFMNIDDLRIPGDVTNESHEGWIELLSVRDGLRREGLGTTRRRSVFVFDGVFVSKLLDRSSVKLREAITDGTFFGEIKIDIIRNCDGNPYTAFALTLSPVQVEMFDLDGSAEEVPVEQLAFNYTRIQTMYTPVRADCSLETPIFSTQDGELLEL